MKRDMELVYRILCFVEANGNSRYKGAVPIEGYERDAIVHHLQLLAASGFVQLGQETLSSMGALLLTWKGYDYVEHLRATRQAAPATTSRPAISQQPVTQQAAQTPTGV